MVSPYCLQQRSKQLTRSTISAVLKEASCVSGRYCIERLTHSLKTSASRLLLASALRRRPLSFEKASSMGLNSGEYGGRQSSSQPVLSRSSLIRSSLWAERLSITTTTCCPHRRLGTRTFPM